MLSLLSCVDWYHMLLVDLVRCYKTHFSGKVLDITFLLKPLWDSKFWHNCLSFLLGYEFVIGEDDGCSNAYAWHVADAVDTPRPSSDISSCIRKKFQPMCVDMLVMQLDWWTRCHILRNLGWNLNRWDWVGGSVDIISPGLDLILFTPCILTLISIWSINFKVSVCHFQVLISSILWYSYVLCQYF